MHAGIVLLLNLPTLERNQTLYSWCAHVHAMNGVSDARATSRALFGAPYAALCHDFPSRLAYLTAHFPDAGLGEVELALGNTLLGYFLVLQPRRVAYRLLALLTNGSLPSIKMRLGITASQVGGHHPLKGCDACVVEDTNKGGFAYWHVEHQFPSTLATSNIQPLTGVIAAHGTKAEGLFCRDVRVASIEKLAGTNWWRNQESHRIRRETDEFLRLIARILEQANSFMFIDPNLDPAAHNYREFHKLLAPLQSRNPRPLIELHRSVRMGDGHDAEVLTEPQWRDRFRGLSAVLASLGLSAQVFLWDDFHDRYLITDIIGLSVPAGFDTTRRPDDITTWSRLSPEDREKWQRWYDPADAVRKLQFKIDIGA